MALNQGGSARSSAARVLSDEIVRRLSSYFNQKFEGTAS